VLKKGDVLTNFSDVVDITVVCKAVVDCEADPCVDEAEAAPSLGNQGFKSISALR
jgi:hypothetical protein